MADPAVSTIKSRIAALNLEEVHAPAPGARPAYSYEQAATNKKPPPPPPSQRPSGQQRVHTVNIPPLVSNATTTSRQPGNLPISSTPNTPKIQPALPPRPPPRTNSQQPPSLPPRTPSEHSMKRRESTESISTIASVGSTKTSMSGASNGGSLYQVRAPAYDPSNLPPVLPKKISTKPKESATLRAMKSPAKVAPKRALPPQLPARPPLPARNGSQAEEAVQPEECQPVHLPRRSALSYGLNRPTETPPPLPASRPSEATGAEHGLPPPIPMATRPNLEAIMASKPKPRAVGSCLKCRDFSAPDDHAARYPRQNLPGSDTAWLSAQLTAPFPSPTDKARAIFTWLHHNVEYDVHSFFSGTRSKSTPESTITTGLAVCEGYASLFAALALEAGLEAIVVRGHGKGYRHSALKPGDPIPEFKPRGHAWNAVRIDDGEWKLIDPCWGAGNVKGPKDGYEKSFKAQWFTMDNDEFGTRHYPEDNANFFRIDGRATISWQEYCLDGVGERLTVYGAAASDHGLGERTFQPAAKHIKVCHPHNSPVVRFQFSALCPHWDNEKHGKGKPYVMLLHVGGRDGKSTDWIPFQTDGRVWWADVNRVELGAPGQKVSVFAVTSIDGRDGRGVSCSDYKAKKGRVAMGFGGVAMWELI